MRNARILHEWEHGGARWAFFLCEHRPGVEPAQMMGTLLMGHHPEEPAEKQMYGIARWKNDGFGHEYWDPRGSEPDEVSGAVFKEFERLIMTVSSPARSSGRNA